MKIKVICIIMLIILFIGFLIGRDNYKIIGDMITKYL